MHNYYFIHYFVLPLQIVPLAVYI